MGDRTGKVESLPVAPAALVTNPRSWRKWVFCSSCATGSASDLGKALEAVSCESASLEHAGTSHGLVLKHGSPKASSGR